MKIKSVVAGILIRVEPSDGSLRFLICQRSRHDRMPLKWEFPGGKIEAGEDAPTALRRELQEELGIDAAIGAEVATLQHGDASGLAIQLAFYRVTSYVGELRNLVFEQFRWVTREEITAFDWLEADVPIVRQIANGEIR